MSEINKYRKDFPFFSQNPEKGLIYFDNAATTHRPYLVIDAMTHFHATQNANPLRGLYALSERATKAYEDARCTVAQFLNASRPEEIIFTRNTTEGLNLIAYTYGMDNIHEGDEIVVSIMEHHSNILPWQMLCKTKGAVLNFLECDSQGNIPESEFSKITPKTKIVSVGHVSNVLGITNPVKKIADIAHKYGAIMVVDGAQSAPHFKIDVQDIGADFYAVSAHKFGGPMGIGALYGKYELLNNMSPFLRGGEMIEYVTKENATWAEVPHKFEAGTVNASGAVGMAAAIRYLNAVGLELIENHCNSLSQIMIEGLKNIPFIHILGNDNPSNHSGIITFTLDGVHPHDIASLLSDENIAIRAGHHCAQPLGKYLNVQSSARASMYLYNTEDEVNSFLEKIAKVRHWSGLE
ncbi:MAG: SufS family cysteine desulfurase [Treponema sp.]|nr:SufS family cysteine desulfurase [Treponema sp.]